MAVLLSVGLGVPVVVMSPVLVAPAAAALAEVLTSEIAPNVGIDGSDDGSLVAFGHTDDPLDPEVAVFDRDTDTVQVLVDGSGYHVRTSGRTATPELVMSGDGGFVAYEPVPGVSGTPDQNMDLALFDLGTNSIEELSVASAAAQSDSPDLDDAGETAVFMSNSTLTGSGVGKWRVVVRDRTATPDDVFHPYSGDLDLSFSDFDPAVSGDGDWVAYGSTRAIDAGDNGDPDIYVVDTDPTTGTAPARISRPRTGQPEFFANSGAPSISDDGRFIAYKTQGGTEVAEIVGAAGLIAGTSGNRIVVTDRDPDGNGIFEPNQIETEQVGFAGISGASPQISGDGLTVAFRTSTRNTAAYPQDFLVQVWRRTSITADWRIVDFSYVTDGQGEDPAPQGRWVLHGDEDRLSKSTLQGNHVLMSREFLGSRYTQAEYELLLRNNAYPAVGDPVSTATGALMIDATDLASPPGTFGLDWSRHYSSASFIEGLFGQGWMNSFDMAAVVLPDGGAEVIDEVGRPVRFEADGSGGWLDAPEFDGSMLERVDGSLAVEFIDGTAWEFDPDGRLEELTNWDGQAVEIARNSNRSLHTVTNTTTGHSLTFNYNAQPFAELPLSSVVRSDGAQVLYQSLSPAGFTVTAPGMTGKTAYVANDAGFITAEYRNRTVADPVGDLIAEQDFNEQGRVMEQRTPSGLPSPNDRVVTTFTYDDEDRSTAVHDSVTNSTVTYTHDAAGRVAQITDPFNNQYVPTYDDDGNLTAATNRASGALTQSFDPATALLTSTDPAGAGESSFTYDDFGRLKTATVPARDLSGATTTATTTYCYDATAYPDNCWADNGQRLPVRVTDDAGGVTTNVVVDGLVLSSTDPDGVTVTHTYGADRRLTSTSDEYANTTRYDYCGDATGETVRVTAPRGAATADDPDPCATVETDDYVTETRYDLAGRVVAQTNPDGGTVTNDYDAVTGQLLETTGPGDQYVTYVYDPATGELAEEHRPAPTGSGATEAVTTYRTEHRVVEGQPREVQVTVDPNGAITEGIYGPLNRLEATRTQTAGAATSTTADDLYRTITYVYDNDGHITGTENDEGDSTVSRYDPAGRLVESCDGEGRRTVNDYHPDTGQLIATHGPWDHDLNTTTCATGPIDNAAPDTTYVHDELGRQRATIDPTGARTETTYTPAGRTATTTDPAGLTTTHHYDNAGRPDLITAPGASGNRTTSYGYDADRNTTTITNGENETTTTTYDPAGRALTTTTPAGVTTTNTYSTTGEIATEQIEGQGPEEYSYDPSGALAWVEDPLGTRTDYTYDLAGRKTSQTDALDGTKVWTYTDDGQVASVTDQLDRTTTYAYDLAGRLETIADPSDRTVTVGYDHSGQQVSRTHDRVISPTVTLTDTYTFGYDAIGRRDTMTDTTGTTTWDYDAAGRVRSVQRGDGRITAYTYDAYGRRASITHPDGNRYDYTYEAGTGRLDTVTPTYTLADTFTTHSNQNAPLDPNRWTLGGANGGASRMADDRGRLVAYDFSGAVAKVTADVGNLTDVDLAASFAEDTSASGTGKFQVVVRDSSAGRYVLVAASGGTDLVLNKVVGSTTTQLGTLTRPTGAGADHTRIRVDGSTLSVRTWAAGTTEPITWGLTVTDTAVTAPGATRLQFQRTTGEGAFFVDDLAITNLATEPAPLLDYTYDNADRVIAEDIPAGSRAWDYTDGLVDTYTQTLPGAGHSTTLDYDSSGRLAVETTGSDTIDYGYDNAGQLLSADSGAGTDYGYTYDPLGRRITDTIDTPTSAAVTTTSVYDAASQLCWSQTGTYTNPTCASPPTDARVYTYDGAGRRAHVDINGDYVEKLHYGTDGTIAKEITWEWNPVGPEDPPINSYRDYDADGHLTRATSVGVDTAVIWDTTQDVPQLIELTPNEVSGDYANYPGDGHRSIQHQGATPEALDLDHRSTPRATIYGNNTYDPYGAPTFSLTDTPPRLAYRGELAVGDYLHLRNRDYDPHTATFTTVDPLSGVNGTTTIANPYHYADNDPVNRDDPLGLQPHDSEFDYQVEVLGEEISLAGLDAARLFSPYHDAVARWIMNKNPGQRAVDFGCQIPGGGRGGGTGRADVCDRETGELWEVKPASDYGFRTGSDQLQRYVDHSPNGVRGRGYAPHLHLESGMPGPTISFSGSRATGDLGVRYYAPLSFPVPGRIRDQYERRTTVEQRLILIDELESAFDVGWNPSPTQVLVGIAAIAAVTCVVATSGGCLPAAAGGLGVVGSNA